MRRQGPIGIGLALLLAGSGTEAQVPPRPEQIQRPAPTFSAPSAEGFRHQLTSGVPVYIVEDHTLPLVQISLALRVGDFLDDPARPGVAALTGAMLRRGGTAALSAEEFDQRADLLAADLDSLSGSTRGGLTLDCATWALDEALELWSGMLLAPRFDAERLTSVKANLRASLATRNDDPLTLLEREWSYLSYGPAHYLSRQLTSTQLDGISGADLARFHDRYWRPETAVIAVSGDVEPDRILSRLESLLAGWTPAGASPPPPPEDGRSMAPPGLYHLENPTPQAKILLGHAGVHLQSWEDAEAFDVLLLSEVLGGGGTVSRLRSRLRAEEGMVYRASARLDLARYGSGDFQIFLETDAAEAPAAIAAALEELHRLRREPVPEIELGFARKSLLHALPLLFDSAEKVAGLFAEDELLGRPHTYWRTYGDNVAAVTPASLQQAARRHLEPASLRLLVVGPWRDLERDGQRRRLSTLLPGRPVHLPLRDPVTLLPVDSSQQP